ncbi:ACP phosphodiesterase [Vicingaceae bacterium]|nr:ACP phosphodiesterase [Vicingaceae bacterium]
MNHLAHLFLSQRDTDLMVGNFIADHIKSTKLSSFSEGIQNGILMHRAIDHFTDTHSIVRKSKERLFPKYSHYSAVLVDMFYNHILAKNWKTYSPISLESFASSAYKLLQSKEIELPLRSVTNLNYMSKQDWLSNYANIAGMSRALKGLSIRASFNSKIDEAIVDLERDFKLYEAEFTPFFAALFEFAMNWETPAK